MTDHARRPELSLWSAAAREMPAALRLFLLSFVSLFLELLVIRWMSMDIRAFTIFKSFPLVVFYVGLGVGFTDRAGLHARRFPVAVLGFAAEMWLAKYFNLGRLVFPSTVSYDWSSLAAASQHLYIIVFLLMFPVLLGIPLYLALTIGSAMAGPFRALRPLTAYSINLGGALAGSIVFACFSFAGFAPWSTLLLPVAMTPWLSHLTPRNRIAVAALCIGAVAIAWSACQPMRGYSVLWSPYQRLDVHPLELAMKDGTPPVEGYQLFANHLPYQHALGLTQDRIGEAPAGLLKLQARWTLPFQLQPYKDVLILASGMGGDVAQALWFGARSIDAVDIDPTILRLGAELNPLRPYADRRVHAIADDARHFISQTRKTYDLVVFSHLDSHTVLGTGSSVRLDNYVYTEQSVAKALTLVRPGGLLVLSFWSVTDWFTNRLYNTIRSAAGYAPLVLQTAIPTALGYETDANTSFILGDAVRNGTFRLPQAAKREFLPADIGPSPEPALTDDWPYLYLDYKLVDSVYLLVLAEIIAALGLLSVPLLSRPASPRRWQLFFMGGAFILLELQLISRLSLLFGSTWITISIVVNGILLMILAANAACIGLRRYLSPRLLPMLYGLLFLTLLGSFLLPVSAMLAGMAGRQWILYPLIVCATLAPVPIAAVIFAISFDGVSDGTTALAFNMLGAAAGALFEYLSNYIGINALLLVVAGFYALSCVFARGAAGSPQALTARS
jgi:SAM-dependent methyltransferase